jgi:hypothetical protein
MMNRLNPLNLTPDQLRWRDYNHESGHAIAAVIRHGYVKSMDFTPNEVETTTDVKKADFAFGVWAGPWAQAYWEQNPTVERMMEIFQTQSFWDWKYYEELLCRTHTSPPSPPCRCKEVREWADRANAAAQLGRPMPTNPPPVTPPKRCWDGELREARYGMERLAADLFKGESPIYLNNGQQLFFKEGLDHEFWWDPDEPTVEDE